MISGIEKLSFKLQVASYRLRATSYTFTSYELQAAGYERPCGGGEVVLVDHGDDWDARIGSGAQLERHPLGQHRLVVEHHHYAARLEDVPDESRPLDLSLRRSQGCG